MSKKNLKPLSKLTKTELFRAKQKQMFNLTSLHRLICIGGLSFLLTLSLPFISYPLPYSPSLQVLAQSNDAKKAQADSLFNQGIEQYQKSQFETALKSWQQALDIYQEIKDRKAEGAALLSLGIAYNSMGDYLKAIDSHKRHLKIAQEIRDRQGEGNSLGNLGLAYLSMGDYPKAIDYHKRCLKILQEIKDRLGEGTALGNIGLAYLSMGDYPKAIEYYEHWLKITQEIKNRQREGSAIDNLGVAYHRMGDYPKAIDYHERSLKILQEMKDHLGEGTVLGNLGVAYSSMGDYLKAIDYHERSLKIAQEIKNRQGEGIALGNLGIAYSSMGDYPKAIEYNERSLKIAQETKKNRQGEGTALGNLGIAYSSMGDYLKAIDYLERSLKIAQEIRDRQGEGIALGNLGIAYSSMGDYPKAIDYHERSLKIAQEIKNRQGEGTALGNLGHVYNSMGDYPKAIEYQERSLKIAQETKNRQGESSVLGNLGNVYNNMGDYPKAIYYHERSLKIDQEIKNRHGEGYALNDLGDTYRSIGDYPKAIDYLERSLKIAQEIKNRHGEGGALSNLGLAYLRIEDYPKAIDYQQRSLKILQEITDREGEGTVLNNIGYTYYKNGNLRNAESTLFDSIKVRESLRGGLKDNNKITISDAQSNTYETLQKVLITQNKTDAALLIAERGRARAFVELLASKLSSQPNEQLSIPPNLDQIKQIADAQNATFVQYSITYDEFKVEGKLQGKESELYIWVIKPTGEVTFRKSDLKTLWQKDNANLSKLISTTRESLGVRDDERNIITMEIVNPGNEKAQQANLQKLHQLLIKPIADLLPTDPNQRVIFLPQNDLFLVPFPALLDEQGKYLIEKHTITTASSIQVLELTRQQKQRIGAGRSIPQNAVVVGNPIMPEYSVKYGEPPMQLKPLPGSEREAKAIAPLLNTQALVGSQATETAIKAKLSQAGVIHFATHGLFDNFQGLQSSIALAPSTKDNGFLTAEEILDLKLKADLVVLSACNTGRGKITGDGVIGLSRSLFIAGTPSVLVSLWAVPDAPTAELMTEFYQNLYQKKLDKAQSLRQAMLKMNKLYPNSPRNWAAFTLTGEAQ